MITVGNSAFFVVVQNALISTNKNLDPEMSSVNITLEAKNYAIEVNGKDFFVVGPIFDENTDKEITPDIYKTFLPKLKGKEARIEREDGHHDIPELNPYSLVGEVVDYWWDDKEQLPFIRVKVGDESREEKQLRKDLLDDQSKLHALRHYKGFSAGLIKVKARDTGAVEKLLPREVSFVRNPACKKCSIKSVEMYSDMSAKPDETMNDVKKFVAEQYAEKVQVLKEMHQRETATYAEKIKELEGKFEAQCAKMKEMTLVQKSMVEENEKYKNEKELSLRQPLLDVILKVENFSAEETKEKSARIVELTSLPVKQLQTIAAGYKRILETYSEVGNLPQGGEMNMEQLAGMRGSVTSNNKKAGVGVTSVKLPGC